jgi:NitT/TauT family transport system permease protein
MTAYRGMTLPSPLPKQSRPAFVRQALKSVIGIVLYAVCIIFVWQLCVTGFHLPPYLVASPAEVARSLTSLSGYYWHHLGATFEESIFGILLGFGAGLIFGVLITHSRVLAKVLHPLLIASQVFPKEALAPLFLVFFGFGILPKVLISALICFFPVTVNTHTGLRTSPREFEMLMHTLGASRWQKFWHLNLPFAAPYVLSSLVVCATLSVIGAVVGEFVGSDKGLGYVIRSANSDIGTERIYAALLLLGLLGTALYGLASFLRKVVFRRFLPH